MIRNKYIEKSGMQMSKEQKRFALKIRRKAHLLDEMKKEESGEQINLIKRVSSNQGKW